MTEADSRTVVHINKEKTSLNNQEISEVKIISQTKSVDDLIKKAKRAIDI